MNYAPHLCHNIWTYFSHDIIELGTARVISYSSALTIFYSVFILLSRKWVNIFKKSVREARDSKCFFLELSSKVYFQKSCGLPSVRKVVIRLCSHSLHPEHHDEHPIYLSVMTELSYICAVQHHSHLPQVSIEHMKSA